MSLAVERRDLAPPQVESVQASERKILQVESLEQVGEYLLSQSPGVAIFDVDGVLKHRALSMRHMLRPGELDPLTLPLLHELQIDGWQSIICTNQYIARRDTRIGALFPGHQVARFLGTRFGYDYTPDSLQRQLGEPNVLGAPIYLPYFYKSLPDSVRDVGFTIRSNNLPVQSGLYMTGDSQSDAAFVWRLQQHLQTQMNVIIPTTFLYMCGKREQ